ncbi:MAG: cell division protein ZapA [Parvularculaceae bacterium]
MALVDVKINSKTYTVMCEDGQEDRLRELAAYMQRHVAEIVSDLGQIGEARLILLAGLTVCDELLEARGRVKTLVAATMRLDAETLGGASRVVDAACARVSDMAERLADAPRD